LLNATRKNQWSLLSHGCALPGVRQQDGSKLYGTHQCWFMLMMLIYWAEAYML